MTSRSRAQAHAKRAHTCTRCNKVCYGNGFAHHERACALGALDEPTRKYLVKWWTKDISPALDSSEHKLLVENRLADISAANIHDERRSVFTKLGVTCAKWLFRKN